MHGFTQHVIRRAVKVDGIGRGDLDVATVCVVNDDHVCHAGEQGAQFGLGSSQLLFRLLALGDVAHHYHSHRPVLESQITASQFTMEGCAVLAQANGFDWRLCAAAHIFKNSFNRVGMNKDENALADQFLPRVPHHARAGLAHIHDGALFVYYNPFVSGLGNKMPPFLALAQRFLGALALGDVHHHSAAFLPILGADYFDVRPKWFMPVFQERDFAGCFAPAC